MVSIPKPELHVADHKPQNLTYSLFITPHITLCPTFFSFLFYQLSQATTSPVEHQERRRTQKDHVGRPEDQGRQSEATYEGGAYEAYGGEEE